MSSFLNVSISFFYLPYMIVKYIWGLLLVRHNKTFEDVHLGSFCYIF